MFASSLTCSGRLVRPLHPVVQRRAFRVSAVLREDDARMRRKLDAVYDEGRYYLKIREEGILGPERTVFLLEEIIDRHRPNFRNKALSTSSFAMFMRLATLYIQELLQLKRTVAATSFTRQFMEVLRERAAEEIQYADCQVVVVLDVLYTLLRESDGDPRERWNIVKEAKELCEKIVPLAWDPNAARSLKDQRARLLQLYALEQDLLLSDPRTRKSSVGSLVATHKQILLLQEGKSNAGATKLRMTSLRAICELEEERATDTQYLSSAQEFSKLADAMFTAAVKEKKIPPEAVYDKAHSYVLLCKAYKRPINVKQIIKTATKGLDFIMGDLRDLPLQVEASQLLVFRSQGYLRSKQPEEALADARAAVRAVEAGNWSIVYQMENVDPIRYKPEHWRNLSMANLCDVLFDSKVVAPEEEYGLLVARAGRAMNKMSKDVNGELQFRLKELGALRRLGRWKEAVGESITLLDEIAKLFPGSGKDHLDLENRVVVACEDAAECLEKLGHQGAADELINEADAFAAYTEQEDDATLADYAVRVGALADKLRSMVQQQVPQAIEQPSLFERLIGR